MYKVTTKTQNDVIDVVLIFSLLTFSSASTVDFEKINATRVGLSGSVYNSFFSTENLLNLIGFYYYEGSNFHVTNKNQFRRPEKEFPTKFNIQL